MVKRLSKLTPKIYMSLIFLFLYLPIFILILFSFNESRSQSVFTGFSLQWYAELLSDRSALSAIYYTFLIAIVSTYFSVILGLLASIGLSKSPKKLKKLLLNFNYLPIINPDIVMAISLMMLFLSFQIGLGLATIIIAHISFSTPFVILCILPKVNGLDPNLAEAALDLGATPKQAMIKVIIPQVMPGIIAGALIAFTMSVDDFVISFFTTGDGIKNISIWVYTMAKRGVRPTVNAISTIIVLVIFSTVGIKQLRSNYLERKGIVKVKRSDRSLSYTLVIGAIIVSSLLFSASNDDRETLRVYNWGEYIDPDVIELFEVTYNVNVVYDLYESNESMYTTIRSGKKYDVMIPSDYFIEKMIDEDLLLEIDFDKITNFDQIMPELLNQTFDPDQAYSVPYFWGNVGILYDTTKVSLEELEEQEWEILRNPDFKNQVFMYDVGRDSFMVALKALGYSMNTEDEAEIEAAKNWLIEQKELVNPVYVTDTVIESMMSSDKALAVVYSGDATAIISENPDMAFYLPLAGTNVWFDSMVISADTQHAELAHKFINFMTDQEQAFANTAYVGYTTSNHLVMDRVLEDDDLGFNEIDSYFPRIGFYMDEVFVHNTLLERLWIEVKAR